MFPIGYADGLFSSTVSTLSFDRVTFELVRLEKAGMMITLPQAHALYELHIYRMRGPRNAPPVPYADVRQYPCGTLSFRLPGGQRLWVFSSGATMQLLTLEEPLLDPMNGTKFSTYISSPYDIPYHAKLRSVSWTLWTLGYVRLGLLLLLAVASAAMLIDIRGARQMMILWALATLVAAGVALFFENEHERSLNGDSSLPIAVPMNAVLTLFALLTLMIPAVRKHHDSLWTRDKVARSGGGGLMVAAGITGIVSVWQLLQMPKTWRDVGALAGGCNLAAVVLLGGFIAACLRMYLRNRRMSPAASALGPVRPLAGLFLLAVLFTLTASASADSSATRPAPVLHLLPYVPPPPAGPEPEIVPKWNEQDPAKCESLYRWSATAGAAALAFWALLRTRRKWIVEPKPKPTESQPSKPTGPMPVLPLEDL